MKRYLMILGALAALTMSACTKDATDEVVKNTYEDGSLIVFNLGEDTRTVYDEEDRLQINWEESDVVRVMSPQAKVGDNYDVHEAAYSVVPDTNEPSTGKLAVNENGLQWTAERTYDFYAVYPGDNAEITMAEGEGNCVATFPMPYDQTCTVVDAAETNIVTTPDMSHAYMVSAANYTVSSENSPITLPFNPIMTTLEVKVKGCKDETAAENQSNTYTVPTIKVSGISIQIPFTSNVAATFQYDMTKGEILDTYGGTFTEEDAAYENLFVGVQSGKDAYVEVGEGETLTLTAFLPPIEISDAKQVKIRVHATGYTELVATLKPAGDDVIKASSKRLINLPDVKYAYTPEEQASVNNWLTPLNDNIYISELSIPGAHDATTGEETQEPTGFLDWIIEAFLNIVRSSYGQTQDLTIKEQMAQGLRCFDFRPAVYNEDGTEKVYLYHGVIRYDMLFGTSMQNLAEYLFEYPGEFGLIIMRHESEIADMGTLLSVFEQDQTNWAKLMNEVFDAERSYTTSAGVTNNYTLRDLIVTWKPDLTLAEARGKIIILSRSDYAYGSYTTHGLITPDYGGKENIECSVIGNGTTYSTAITVQDLYDPGTAAAKWNAVQPMLDEAAEVSLAETPNYMWYLNHASGYLDNSATTSSYQSNAAATNKAVYDYITSDTWKGSTGIVLIDYVGVETYYGDILPQAIVDNNYKYYLKRKSN